MSNVMFRVLVTWCEIPEDVWFLPLEVCEEKANLLIGFHGKFINSASLDKETDKQMNDFFYDKEGTFKFMSQRTKNMLSHEKFDYVIFTGFML